MGSLISIKHRHHLRLGRDGVPIDLLQAIVQVGRLGVGLALTLGAGHPDDWDAMHLVQRIDHLLTKSNGGKGLPIVALLPVLWRVVTQVDVDCKAPDLVSEVASTGFGGSITCQGRMWC